MLIGSKSTSTEAPRVAAGRSAAASPGLSKVILLAVSFLIIVISFYQVIGQPRAHDNWTIAVSFTCLTWVGVYFFCSYLQFRSFYLFTSVYIIPLCAFHLGVVVPDAIGWFDAVGWDSGPLAPWLERAGWFTAIALGSIGVGFAASLNKSLVRREHVPVPLDVTQESLRLAFWAGTGLLVASIIFLGLGVRSVGNLLEISRTDIFVGVGDTRGLGAFLMVYPGAVILLVIGARSKAQRMFAWFVAGISFAVMTLSGYRTQAFFPLLVGMIAWVKVGRRIPTIYAASIFALILILIPIIGTLRALDAYKDINLQTIDAASKGAKIENAFKEMGGSLGVAAHVFRLVPKQDPYRYGTTYLDSLREAIPNIGFTQSESIAAQVKKGSTDPKLITKMAPAFWITYRADPASFKAGGGIGFSAIAEPYLNFGPLAVVGFFILLGYLLGRLDQNNLLLHPWLLVFSCSIFWALAQTVRNTLGGFIKPVVFVVISLLIWHLGTHLFRKKRVAYSSRKPG